MTLRRLSLIVLTAALGLTFFGCDLIGTDEEQSSVVTEGVYVANQGNFGDGNGSVSLYNPDTETVTSEAIGNLNSIVQSITLRNDRLLPRRELRRPPRRLRRGRPDTGGPADRFQWPAVPSVH